LRGAGFLCLGLAAKPAVGFLRCGSREAHLIRQPFGLPPSPRGEGAGLLPFLKQSSPPLPRFHHLFTTVKPLSRQNPTKPVIFPPQILHYEQNVTKRLGIYFNLSGTLLTLLEQHAILQASKRMEEMLKYKTIGHSMPAGKAFHLFVIL